MTGAINKKGSPRYSLRRTELYQGDQDIQLIIFETTPVPSLLRQ